MLACVCYIWVKCWWKCYIMIILKINMATIQDCFSPSPDGLIYEINMKGVYSDFSKDKEMKKL